MKSKLDQKLIVHELNHISKTREFYTINQIQVKELKQLAHDLYEAVRKSTFAPEGFGKLKRKVFKELQHLQTVNIIL